MSLLTPAQRLQELEAMEARLIEWRDKLYEQPLMGKFLGAELDARMRGVASDVVLAELAAKENQ